MDGRKADALAAAQGADAAAGAAGSGLAGPYAVLVRFGLWDELIALGPPDARSPALTAGYLYGRGVALAARGRLDEARGALEALGQLAATTPELAQAIAVAAPVVAARIAASGRHDEAAVAALLQAVAAEDRLTPTVPGGWFFPVRDLLGAQLLIAGHAAEAERIYREDLARNPGSGWALYGLAAAQRAEGRMRAAAMTQRAFARAWKHADVRLDASAFWFAGPDTTSCECQRRSFR
jgi:tetratricopeptide (TPR) repeat protein